MKKAEIKSFGDAFFHSYYYAKTLLECDPDDVSNLSKLIEMMDIDMSLALASAQKEEK